MHSHYYSASSATGPSVGPISFILGPNGAVGAKTAREEQLWADLFGLYRLKTSFKLLMFKITIFYDLKIIIKTKYFWGGM